jgi:hypothetical protein
VSNQQDFLIFVSRLYHLQNDTNRHCDEKLRIDRQQLEDVGVDESNTQSSGPNGNRVDAHGEVYRIRYKKYHVKRFGVVYFTLDSPQMSHQQKPLSSLRQSNDNQSVKTASEQDCFVEDSQD